MWNRPLLALTTSLTLLAGANVAQAEQAKSGIDQALESPLMERANDYRPSFATDSHETIAATDHMQAAKPNHSSGHSSPWSYRGQNGPNKWSLLKSEYATCGKGRMQSPINLQGPAVKGKVDIEFRYQASILQVLNNGHTFQVNYGDGSYIIVNGDRFDLLQFHFHSPSEHGRDGVRYPIEAHLVHKNAKGQLAVVGVFMESGAENISLMEMWDHMPMHAGPAKEIKRVAINAADLVPAGTQFYRYMGSLTTPPCSEGVNWFVANEPINVSPEQIKKFVQAVGGENARPLQALNNRLLAGPMQQN